MTTYLGIDYGLAHLGLALADGPLARPLNSLNMDDPAIIISTLTSLIHAHQVDAIVLGLPEGDLAPVVTKFARSLSAAFSLPVHLHSEILSTKEALTKLRALGAKKKKLQNDHVYAACLILEDYLESHSSP